MVPTGLGGPGGNTSCKAKWSVSPPPKTGRGNTGHFSEGAPSIKGDAHLHWLLETQPLHLQGASQEGSLHRTLFWAQAPSLQVPRDPRSPGWVQGCPACRWFLGAGNWARDMRPLRSLPTASSNLCTDVNASPFLSANNTCFLGLWGSGGRAKQERKDDWGHSSPGPACGGCSRWAVAEAEVHEAVHSTDDLLAARGPLTKEEGSSDEEQKDQVFSTAACASVRSSLLTGV